MSFSEIILIAIVAIVVLGPDKLPKLAFTAGRYWRYWRNLLKMLQADLRRQAPHLTLPPSIPSTPAPPKTEAHDKE